MGRDNMVTMANKVSPARGMRDILPVDKEKRERVLGTIRKTYKKYGYNEIETPALEPLTRLRSNQGGENESMLFTILRRGLDPESEVRVSEAADLGLRYDLTLPLTRYYATHHGELPGVFRALQTGPVWRAERPQKGRFRQFTQCDIDILGEAGIVAEIDLITTTLAAFTELGLGEKITVVVNDRRVLHDILAAAGVAADCSGAALIALDKIDKIAASGVAAELVEEAKMTQHGANDLVKALSAARGASDEALDSGEISVGERVVSLRDLPEIVQRVRDARPDARLTLDPMLVRGMGYYTGPIFEVKHDDLGISVAGGGRYDGVVGKWLGTEVPACGFSIGFERIIDLVEDDVYDTHRAAVLYRDETDISELLQQRDSLVNTGFNVGLVPAPRKLKGTFMDSLAEQGYTHVVKWFPDTGFAQPRELG